MFRHIFTVLSTLILAAGILTTSFFRASSVSYSFNNSGYIEGVLGVAGGNQIDYDLGSPGKILPDHPLWPVVALKDRFWLWFTFDSKGKAEVCQALADKRLVASQKLFEKGKPEIAFSTLTKAENYLTHVLGHIEDAKKRGVEVGGLLKTHAQASLKHTEEIEKMLEIAPEDARPGITKAGDQPKNSFKKTRDMLNEKGLPVPENPFESN